MIKDIHLMEQLLLEDLYFHQSQQGFLTNSKEDLEVL